MKTSRVALVAVLLIAVAAAGVLVTRLRIQSSDGAPQSPGVTSADTLTDPTLPVTVPVSELASLPGLPVSQPSVAESVGENPIATNKLDRLTQIRETFRALAAGDKRTAMRAARQIADGNERETALLTLVAEWTQGELSSPGIRAARIARFGLEGGLGLELERQPELALMWADELAEGPGRALVIQAAASTLVTSDPAAAFALARQFPASKQRSFSDELFSTWASQDTDAALKWAEHLPETTERDAALEAIRTTAPVGIGAVLNADGDGYAIIANLIQGMPAECSGQLRVGDRIMAIAQGGGAFTDLGGVPLADIVQAIRGAPNTMIQLRVVSADAPANTPPRTVLIMRDQMKFKR